MLWKATTLVFACTSLWLGWPEAEERSHRAPIPRTFDAWEVEEAPVIGATTHIHDVIAAMRAGEIELAQRSIEDPRPRVSRAAVEALFRVGASDVLADAIHEDAPPWRLDRIVNALGWIADELSVRKLSELLEDDRIPIEPWKIAEALGTTTSPAALPALRRFVERRTDPMTVDRGLAAVAYLASPESERLILSWAEGPGMLGRYALARLDPESAGVQPVLRDALMGDASRAIAAAMALEASPEVLHDELLQCADRRDDARIVCTQLLATRGEVELVATRLDGRGDLDEIAFELAATENGREVLERLSRSDTYETRQTALVALASRSESARAELIAMANEGNGTTRISLGVELLNLGAPEGVELVVDALLSNSSFAHHHSALGSLAADREHGVPALRDLARSAGGSVGHSARAMLLSRQQLDDEDVDIIAAALEDGDASVLVELRAETLPPRALRMLEGYLDHPELRNVAMNALAARVPADEAIRLAGNDSELQAIMLQASPHDVRSFDRVVRELSQQSADLSSFLDAAGDGPAVQRYLAESLPSRRGDERVEVFETISRGLPGEDLEHYASDADPDVRQIAMRHLANREGPESTRAGLMGIRDSDPDVRRVAIDALSSSSDPSAANALIDATRDQDDDVALAAIGTVLFTVGGDHVVDDLVDQAFDPYFSPVRRTQIANRLLRSRHDLDDATRARLSEIAPPRVILLDQL